MPTWRGKPIPFDPDIIARLLFEGEGEHVKPDEGISDKQYQQEQSLVLEKLRKLWGDRRYRAVTNTEKGMRNILKRGGRQEDLTIKREGDTREDTEIGLPEEILSTFGIRRIIPNPFLQRSEMPTDERDVPVNNRRKIVPWNI